MKRNRTNGSYPVHQLAVCVACDDGKLVAPAIRKITIIVVNMQNEHVNGVDSL